VIKLHRKRKVDPEKDMDWVKSRLHAIKFKKAIDKKKAEIEKDIDLQFYSEAVNIAFDALPEDIPFEDILDRKVTRSNAPKVEIPPKFRDMLIATHKDGSYTLDDFADIYNRTPLPERPRRQYGRRNIIETIHKVIFDKILPVYAEKEAKVLEIPEVRELLDRKKEMILVQRLYDDQIKDEVTITIQDMKDYYAENLDMLMLGEQRDYSIILVPDKELADEIYQKAIGGESFAQLVRQYSSSIDKKNEAVGKSGLHFKGDMPEYDEVAFALEGVGDISEPFRSPRGYAILKIEEIEADRIPTYEEAEYMIRKTLREIRYEEHLHKKLEKWSEDYEIEIDEAALARARLERTKT
jgi:hypothetical protein